MPNHRWACTPQGMSQSEKSSPAMKAWRRRTASIKRHAVAVSSIATAIAFRSRCSAGVRTRPQNTTDIGRFSSVCCASIQRSMLARARGSAGHKGAAGMAVRQIAQDRVALPQCEALFLQRRHQSGGILGAIFRSLRFAERGTCIDALERERHLAQSPQHLHHITGRGAPPYDPLHKFLPRRRFFR